VLKWHLTEEIETRHVTPRPNKLGPGQEEGKCWDPYVCRDGKKFIKKKAHRRLIAVYL
jgi:hypothetical protein